MSKSSGYSESEILRMQEEAILRVRQMQDRARRTAQAGQDPEAFVQEEVSQEAQPEVVEPEVVDAAPGTGSGRTSRIPGLAGLGNLGNIFSASGSSPISSLLNWAGGDRIIILVLLALLLGDDGDQTLILALCYLLLFD